MVTMTIGGQATDWIDVVGKLGPVIVALLVGWVSWVQSQVVRRQQSIDEQSYRLTLLTARRPVLAQIEDALAKSIIHGVIDDGTMLQISQAARESRYLFPNAIWLQVRDLSNHLNQVRKARRNVHQGHVIPPDKPMSIEELVQLEGLTHPMFEALTAAMSDEMRVEGNDPNTRLATKAALATGEQPQT